MEVAGGQRGFDLLGDAQDLGDFISVCPPCLSFLHKTFKKIILFPPPIYWIAPSSYFITLFCITLKLSHFLLIFRDLIPYLSHKCYVLHFKMLFQN